MRVFTDQYGHQRSLALKSATAPVVGRGDDGFLWIDVGVTGTEAAPVLRQWHEETATWIDITAAPVPPVATAFTSLSDVPNSYAGQAGLLLAVNGTENGLTTVSIPTPTFTGLSDAPGSYFAAENKLVAVNATADGLEFVDAGAGTGDVLYADIQAGHLVNEVMGWPPNVVDGSDLVTQSLWFRDIGTPTTHATVVHVAGESGITETYERALKCVADAGSEGFKTLAWTYADQPRVKSGRVLSAIFAIWCVGGVGVTAKLVNSDASETAAAEVTAAAWTIVKVENHTLAGTSCELQFVADGAGTFYVAALSANIGAKALPLGARPLRFVGSISGSRVVNGVDPADTNYADADCTTHSSPLTVSLQIAVNYHNASGSNAGLYVRRKGETATPESIVTCIKGIYVTGSAFVACNDGQVVEWKTTAGGGYTEGVYLLVTGYWEWA